jgi:glycosyltransferase involved in cell wall biosynthesis
MQPLNAGPRISICMPVYNGGHYFALALESALAQTWPNCEIVVVDDGSTDGGESERNAARGGSRVRYIRQQNRGVAGALNTAVEAMTGDIFCWLSHDDLYEPHKTEAQVDYHRRLGRRDAVLFSDYHVIDAKGKLVNRVSSDRQRLLRAPMLALLNRNIKASWRR